MPYRALDRIHLGVLVQSSTVAEHEDSSKQWFDFCPRWAPVMTVTLAYAPVAGNRAHCTHYLQKPGCQQYKTAHKNTVFPSGYTCQSRRYITKVFNVQAQHKD